MSKRQPITQDLEVCQSCGAEAAAGWTFCGSCGGPLHDVSSATESGADATVVELPARVADRDNTYDEGVVLVEHTDDAPLGRSARRPPVGRWGWSRSRWIGVTVSTLAVLALL